LAKHQIVSLFTGAGGLDLGLALVGFEPVLCVELDDDSRETLKINRPSWRLSQRNDIQSFKPGDLLKQISLRPRELPLLVGGPPCQPFSKAGYWANGDGRRLKDPRAKTLNAYLRIVDEVLPHAFLLENVAGLAYSGKDEGIRLVEKEIAAINKRHRTKYKVHTVHLNAADYGVPQLRARVFLLASIDGADFRMRTPTHGIQKGQQQHRTAWDAIGHLDEDDWSADLNPTGRWAELLPSLPEGANYLWHTPRNTKKGAEPLFGWRTRYWSFLLKLSKRLPAWTIQAEPGPATGPFHWRSRLLSISELSALQTFPVGYLFYGDRRSVQRQIGNAVPSAIGELLGIEIRRQFFGERPHRDLTLIPSHRRDCPPAERRRKVPSKYFDLRKKYKEHPGPGLGPGARRRKAKSVPTSD
jgi:DNA (cytosine-5)-methyltransferase 1